MFISNNIRLTTIKENLGGDDSISRLILQIMASINEFEVNQLGERISSIKQDKKSNGKSYGRAPYGYVNKMGKIFVDEYEMKVKTRVSRMRDYGSSWKSIEDELYGEGIRSRSGGRLFAGTLNNMLKWEEPKHNGVLVDNE